MTESETEIRLTLRPKGVTLTSGRTGRFPSLFCRREASDILALIPSLFALCPAAHVCAFTSAFETADSGLEIQNISILSRIEAVLETIRFFSMDLRKALGLGPAAGELVRNLAAARARLLASLQGQSDSSLMTDTAQLAKKWLAEESDLFKALSKKTRELRDFALPAEAVLPTQELLDPTTLGALAVTLRDCPQYALRPRLGGPRVVGAVARRARHGKKLLTPEDIFNARINEIASLVSGKSSLVGSLKTVSLDGKLAASLVETARGVLVYFVLRSNNTPIWVDWIAPTEWVFQPDGLLTKLADDARKAGASAEQIALIAAAFDACAEVVVSEEPPHA